MIHKEHALNYLTFYHIRLKNADGTAVRCRANGKCKAWVTRPADFRLPVKRGLKQCFYLTPFNAAGWTTEEPIHKEKE